MLIAGDGCIYSCSRYRLEGSFISLELLDDDVVVRFKGAAVYFQYHIHVVGHRATVRIGIIYVRIVEITVIAGGSDPRQCVLTGKPGSAERPQSRRHYGDGRPCIRYKRSIGTVLAAMMTSFISAKMEPGRIWACLKIGKQWSFKIHVRRFTTYVATGKIFKGAELQQE